MDVVTTVVIWLRNWKHDQRYTYDVWMFYHIQTTNGIKYSVYVQGSVYMWIPYIVVNEARTMYAKCVSCLLLSHLARMRH